MSENPSDTNQIEHNVIDKDILVYKPDMVRTYSRPHLVTTPNPTNDFNSLNMSHISPPVLRRSNGTAHIKHTENTENTENNRHLIDVMEEYILHEHK